MEREAFVNLTLRIHIAERCIRDVVDVEVLLATSTFHH